MSDTTLTTEQIAAIRARLTAVRTKKPSTQAYWTALSVWQANAADDIDALLAAYEATIAENGRLKEQLEIRRENFDQANLDHAAFIGELWTILGFTYGWDYPANGQYHIINRLKELTRTREGILADAQRLRGIAPAVNVAAGQEDYDGDVADRGSDYSKYTLYRDETYESGRFPLNFSEWFARYGEVGN